MAIELAIKMRITVDYGIKCILENVDNNISDDEVLEKYKNNLLMVKEFEALKNFLKSKKEYNLFFSEEYSYMERFLKYRNKLVHFDYNFSDTEYLQLKDDIIHIIVNILHVLMSSLVSDDEYRKFMVDEIDKREYEKLLNNPKYQKALLEMINHEYGDAYFCPICGRDLLVPTKKCLGCLENFDNPNIYGFVECNYCGKEAVLYDNCNIDYNEEIRALCLSCKNDTFVYKCKVCGNVSNIESMNKNICTRGNCIFDD